MAKIESPQNPSHMEIVRERRNLVKKHQAEVQRINQSYNQLKKDMKTEGETKVTQQRIQNEERISEEGKRKNEVLKRMRDLTNSATQMLQQEQERVKNSTEDNIQRSRLKSEQSIGDIRNKNQEMLTEETSRYNKELQDIHAEANRIRYSKYDQHMENIREQNRTHDEKMTSLHEDYKGKLESADTKNHAILMDQRRAYAKEIESRKLMHDMQIKRLKMTQESEYTNLQKANKQATDGVKKNFEDKYSKIREKHLSQMKNLKNIISEDLNQTISNYSLNKKIVEDKGQDYFYRIENLTPIITEETDSYIIRMRIPEHEKDHVSISGRGKRKIRISMDRNYREEFTDGMGMKSSSKKYETTSKEIGFADIIDYKNINKKYENGELIFTLKKA